ncbi:MAG: RtcB family protein, partial [Chloroflexi bacterium]|nr:RtcB family protein [Chloroflexota bacterium]
MEIHESGGKQVVRSWASILDPQTLEQALMTARCDAMAGPLALMPDAHLGAGSTVGSVLLTNGIIPAAVGVDIGCGVSAFKTSIKRHEINDQTSRRILGRIRETIPSGVGKAHTKPSALAHEFVKWRGWPSIKKEEKRILSQFGTLGSGNHFAEVSEDLEGSVWVLVHSGSRGTGNLIAQHHIAVARSLGHKVENPALSYFSPGTSELSDYVSD